MRRGADMDKPASTGLWLAIALALLVTGSGCDEEPPAEVEEQPAPATTVMWSGTVGGPVNGRCHLDISGYDLGAQRINCRGGCGDVPGSCILRWRKQTPPGTAPAAWNHTVGVTSVGKNSTVLPAPDGAVPDSQLEFMCFCR